MSLSLVLSSLRGGIDSAAGRLLEGADCLGSVLPAAPKLKKSRLWRTVSPQREPGRLSPAGTARPVVVGLLSQGPLYPGDFPLLHIIRSQRCLPTSPLEPGLPLPAHSLLSWLGLFCCVFPPWRPSIPGLPPPCHRAPPPPAAPSVGQATGRGCRKALPSVPPSPFLRAASPGREELRLQGLNGAFYSAALTGRV